MKINRYMYGSRNEGLLKEQRSRMRSPEQAAAEAYAPYGAVADIADTVGGVLEAENQKQIDEQNKDDAATAALQVTNYKNLSSNLAKQAEQEGWEEERYRQEQEHLNKTLLKSSEMISDRNRSEIANSFINTVSMTRPEIARNAYTIKRGKQAEEFDEQRAQAINNREWETVMFLDEMANKSGFINDAELEERNRFVDAQVTALNLAEDYARAVDSGTADQFMQKVGNAGYNDETLAAFSVEKNKIDAFSAQIKKEQKIAKGLDYQKFLHSVDSNTPIEVIDQYAKENELNGDQISRLYTRKHQKDTATSIQVGLWADSSSATNRKALNSAVPQGETVEDTLDNAILVTQQAGMSPMMLSNGLENLAQTDDPQSVAIAGEAYVKYEEVANPIPLPMNDYTTAKMEYYKDMRRELGMNPVTASTATVAEFQDVTEETIKQYRQAWADPQAGSDGRKGVSPQELVSEAVKDAVSDPAGPMKSRLIATQGFFVNNRDINDMQIPPAMSAQVNMVGERMYAITGSEQVSTNSVLRVLANNGWAATDINKGIKATEEDEYNYQFQRNPVTVQQGKVVPASKPRSMLAKDISGQKFTADFMQEKARPYSPNELEFGEGIQIEETGDQLKWPIMYRGGPLRYAEGPYAGMQVYFTYSRDDKKDESERVDIPERQSTGFEGTTIDEGVLQ